MENVKELYSNHDGFKMYVSKYCKLYGYTVQEALTHALVREVARCYMKKPAATAVNANATNTTVCHYTGDLGNGILV